MFHSRAFTIIEVLIVMTIIALLMALIMAVMNPHAAHEVKSLATIKDVEGALGIQRTLSQSQPLQHLAANDFSDHDLITIASRNHELRCILSSHNVEFEELGSQAHQTNIKYKVPSITILNSNPIENICIVDAWNQPLVFKPYTSYMTAPTGWPTTGPRRYAPPAKRSYQIWSAGLNEIYEMNSADADPSTYKRYTDNTDADGYLYIDDIVSWKRSNN